MARIMIVDDDDEIIKMLGFILKNAGYAICAAKNGEKALQLVREEKPDLILMDMYMPDMDGVEAIEELQKNEVSRDIPIIVVSGAIKEMEFMKTVLLGPVSYIEKPFSPKDLLYQVKTQLEKN